MREAEGWKGGKDVKRIRERKDGREALTFLNVVGLDRLDATLYV